MCPFVYWDQLALHEMWHCHQDQAFVHHLDDQIQIPVGKIRKISIPWHFHPSSTIKCTKKYKMSPHFSQLRARPGIDLNSVYAEGNA
jgi:hypothetical protein